VAPLVAELARHPQAWGAMPIRTAFAQSPHHAATDIVLRFPPGVGLDMAADAYLDAASTLERVWYPPAALFPGIVAFIGARFGPSVGSVVLARLPAGGMIVPHGDRVWQAEQAYPHRLPPVFAFRRYQVVLTGRAVFWCDDARAEMAAGEMWWFDNARTHSVCNHGDTDRIVLIVDAMEAPDGGHHDRQ
jgi:hypothetical protein